MSYYLTKEDWVEIAYALEDKLKSPVVQGDGSWVRHIRTIQDIIGPDGVNMTEEAPAAPRAFIYVDGGIVQAIACDTPLDVFIIDYDIEGMEDQSLKWDDDEGEIKEAFVQHWDGSGIDTVRPFELAIETAYHAENK